MSVNDRLARYGARLHTIDGARVVEMIDPNDNSRSRHQYQRYNDVLLRRRLQADGTPLTDWTALTREEFGALLRVRGEFHPILDPLEF